MKKTFQKIATRLVLLLSFFGIQKIALADTGNDDGIYTYGEFFSQPWVWGVIALIIGLVVAAMFVGRTPKEQEMINE